MIQPRRVGCETGGTAVEHVEVHEFGVRGVVGAGEAEDV